MEAAYVDRHIDLVTRATECLNLYSSFKDGYKVSFTADFTGAYPRILAKLEPTDRTPAPGPWLEALPERTVVIRPFYMPMGKIEHPERDANTFAEADFDHALAIGYDTGDGLPLKALFFMPTDALLDGRKPDKEDGLWHVYWLGSLRVNQISLDPRRKFSRILYMADRMADELAYRYQRAGSLYSRL